MSSDIEMSDQEMGDQDYGDQDSDSNSQLSSLAWGDRSPGDSEATNSDTGARSPTGFHFVEGYPLDVEDVYRSFPPDSPALLSPSSGAGSPPETPHGPSPSSNDPRVRMFKALFDIDLLDRTKPADVAASIGGDRSYGVLRKKWKTRFQRDSNGEWDYVEYVPAWTDPDWDERYVWMGAGNPWPEDHPLAMLYAKPGSMQTQRPALLPSDATLNPTPAATRWGFYPYRTGQFQLNGTSGVTPTQPGFPTVRLDFPTWSTEKNRACFEVTIEDLNASRAQYQALYGDNSEEGFRAHLDNRANNVFEQGSLQWDQVDKLLQLFDLIVEKETREEYQSLLFSGHTTNELVRKGIWTMGMDATFDIADAPLHDLVTRDKWANTEGRGKDPDEPRIVYDISGRRGELTAHNDEVWQALQPALQLVSKVLASDHPIILGWADLRNLEPVRDERAMNKDLSVQDIDGKFTVHNIYRHDKFSVWPDFSGLEEDMSRIIGRWNDISVLIKAGFDTTKYVCGILKHTIEWDIQPAYRLGEETNQKPWPAWGSTDMELEKAPRLTRPFKTRVSFAAEIIWQLLVEDYSPAEKAAVSFGLAAVMLHELAHALKQARLQMCGPEPEPKDPGNLYTDPWNPKRTDTPLWMELNPAWRQEIGRVEYETGLEIFKALRIHGIRNKLVEWHFRNGLMKSCFQDYMEDDPKSEEGFATEYRCFGGIIDSLSTGSRIFSLGQQEDPRFFSHGLTLPSLSYWNRGIARPQIFQMMQALPAETYLKLFRRDFWEGSFRAFGHEAMMLTTEQPLQATTSMTRIRWGMIKDKFGRYATEWIRNAHDRLCDENDNQVLWRWLYYKTVLSVEHLDVQRIWFSTRDHWGSTDLAIWQSAKLIKSVNEELRNYLIFRGPSDGVFDTPARRVTQTRIDSMSSDPLEVHEWFRDLYSMLRLLVRDLNREATWNQNMAAAYVRLEDMGTQQRIHQVYASKFRARMGLIYIRSVEEMVQVLDSWDSYNDMTLALLNATDGVRQIMGEGRDKLKSQFKALETAFSAAMGVFCDDDEEERQLALQNLNAIPERAVQSNAGRVEHIAKLEYSRLPPGSSLKNIADDWMLILQSGDDLISPPPGSDGDVFNKALDDRNRSINLAANAQRQAAEAAHPDPQDVAQEQVMSLSSQQPHYGFNDQQQQQHAAAAGYRPIVDPRTGFTRYERVQEIGGFAQWAPGGQVPAQNVFAPVGLPMAPMAPVNPNFANLPNQNPHIGQDRGWQQGP